MTLINSIKLKISKIAKNAVKDNIEISKFHINYNPESTEKAETLIKLILNCKYLKILSINKNRKDLKKFMDFKLEEIKVSVNITDGVVFINGDKYHLTDIVRNNVEKRG